MSIQQKMLDYLDEIKSLKLMNPDENPALEDEIMKYEHQYNQLETVTFHFTHKRPRYKSVDSLKIQELVNSEAITSWVQVYKYRIDSSIDKIEIDRYNFNIEFEDEIFRNRFYNL